MEQDEVRNLNIPKLENHPAKFLLGGLLATVVGAWAVMKPVIVEDLSTDFIPSAHAEVAHKEIKEEVQAAQEVLNYRIDGLEDKIDENSRTTKSLQTEVRLTAAFQLERSLKMDLEAHKNQPEDTRDINWSSDIARLQRQTGLATDYKNCLLENKPNCDYLQRQLWQ